MGGRCQAGKLSASAKLARRFGGDGGPGHPRFRSARGPLSRGIRELPAVELVVSVRHMADVAASNPYPGYMRMQAVFCQEGSQIVAEDLLQPLINISGHYVDCQFWFFNAGL